MLKELMEEYSVFLANISDSLRTMQQSDFDNGVLNRRVYIDTEALPLSSPFVKEKQIFFTESFLNFLWAICHYLSAMTEEYSLLQKRRGQPGADTQPFNVSRAMLLVDWALQLRQRSTPWPSSIVTPYLDDEIVKYTNIIFFRALAFIFFHEYAHAKLGHSPTVSSEIRIAQENEADNYSLETIYTELLEEEEKTFYTIGVACADIAMLYAISNGSAVKQKNHQDLDIRLFNHLGFFQMNDSNKQRYVHALVMIGLQGFIGMHGVKTDKTKSFSKAWDYIEYYSELIHNLKEFT